MENVLELITGLSILAGIGVTLVVIGLVYSLFYISEKERKKHEKLEKNLCDKCLKKYIHG